MRYLRPVATAVAAVLVALAPLSVTVGADAAVKKKRTPPTHMRVATFNTANWQTDARAIADIKRLVDSGIGVISLQEMWNKPRRDMVSSQFLDCETCLYDGNVAARAMEGATPILWRTAKFALLESGNQQVTDDWYVGEGGAGPATLQERFVTWVKLQERKSGLPLYVLNTHFAASVQGPDGGPNTKYPQRLAHYRHQMGGLKDLVRSFQATGAPVFVTGDFNVNYRRDKIVRTAYFPYAGLGSVGVRASYYSAGEPAIGSHLLRNGNGSRLIDYVAHTFGPQVTALRNDVLTGYNSDHRPVLAKFALK